MNRPTLESVPDARAVRLTVRFTARELAWIQRRARARGLTPSAFVRRVACDAAHPRAPAQTALPTPSVEAPSPQLSPAEVAVVDAARGEHKRAAVNLNQLARLAHRGELDLGHLEPVVVELARQVEHLVDLLADPRAGRLRRRVSS